MTLVLRAEPPPPSTTLLIHMGAGALDSVVNAALRNYGEYRSTTSDGSGVFAVSVFAVEGIVTEAQILHALPQRSFARTTVTDAGFGLLARSTLDPGLDPAIAAIQSVHYDIALPPLDDPRLVAVDPPDDEDLEHAARAHLEPHAHRLLALFSPRQPK